MKKEEEIKEEIESLSGKKVDSVDLKTGPPPLSKSRGFCFVTFSDHESADHVKTVLSSLQQSKLAGVRWCFVFFVSHFCGFFF